MEYSPTKYDIIVGSRGDIHMSKDYITNLNLLDNCINMLETMKNQNYNRRTFLALTGSIGIGFALSGCASNTVKEETNQNEEPKENTPEIKDDASAAFTALEIIKETTQELKTSSDEIRQTPEMTQKVQNAVTNFDVLYKFMIGEDFDKLEDNDKIDMITASMSFVEIINTVEPNYKEEISTRWTEIKEKCSDYIEKHDLYNKAVDLGASAYEKASNAWDSLKDYAKDVKEEAKSR